MTPQRMQDRLRCSLLSPAQGAVHTDTPADTWRQMQPSAEAHAAHVDGVGAAMEAVACARGPCALWPRCLPYPACSPQAC